MKSCPCGADATLPFSMRHFGNGDVFFPPLVKGGGQGGVVSEQSGTIHAKIWPSNEHASPNWL
jgi:hypothetical protein